MQGQQFGPRTSEGEGNEILGQDRRPATAGTEAAAWEGSPWHQASGADVTVVLGTKDSLGGLEYGCVMTGSV